MRNAGGLDCAIIVAAIFGMIPDDALTDGVSYATKPFARRAALIVPVMGTAMSRAKFWIYGVPADGFDAKGRLIVTPVKIQESSCRRHRVSREIQRLKEIYRSAYIFAARPLPGGLPDYRTIMWR